MKEFANELLTSVRKSVKEHNDDAFEDGYNEAANICVGVLSEVIDGLLKKINLDSRLSDQEQFLLSKLHEIRSEMETMLHDSCANAGSG